MGQSLKIDFMFPSPIFPSLRVINRRWPRISSLLPMIGLVRNLKVRNQVLYLLGQLLSLKTYGCQIVASPHFDIGLWGFHELDCSTDSIVHVHHRQHRVLTHKTLILPMSKSLVKNSHCIIGGSSSRLSLPADDARISETSHVEAILFIIVLAQELARKLGNPVHGCRFIYGMLGGVLTGGCGPEASY